MWGLTKRFSQYKTKWNGKDYSYSPFSTDGRHNASQSANTMGVGVKRTKTDKGSKRTFTMTLKKKQKNGIQKTKTGRQGNAAVAVMTLAACPNRAARTI